MATVDRKERVQVDLHEGKQIARREVVEDIGKERQMIVARLVQIMWLCVIALESLLGIRFLLKLLAANPSVPFARFIYNISHLFLIPFAGLTATPAAEGMVFEISTAIAMIVYLLAGWLAVQLIWLVLKPSRRRTVRTYEEND